MTVSRIGSSPSRASLRRRVPTVTRTVWVKVEPVDAGTTRVIVQARTKGGGSDLDLASDIDKQIALRLQSGNLTPATPPAATNAQRRGT